MDYNQLLYNDVCHIKKIIYQLYFVDYEHKLVKSCEQKFVQNFRCKIFYLYAISYCIKMRCVGFHGCF